MLEYKHLEKKDGRWFFAGRKLAVFENVFFFKNAPWHPSRREWEETYGFSEEDFDEALACVEAHSDDYERWVADFLKTDSEP